MKIIDFDSIQELNINPLTCVKWVREVFLNKDENILPQKVSISCPDNVFFNTMPCLLQNNAHFGVKVVSRFPKRTPSLMADILLYDSNTGVLKAIIDGGWITTMRTGAVAALAVDTFKTSGETRIGVLGLGNTARATLLCIQALYEGKEIHVNILAYKGQEKLFIDRFREYSNIKFSIYNEVDSMFKESNVIVSCITATDTILASDEIYREGVLIVPVHTRGFQNCDLFFDKVYADDYNHVKDFKYFNQFKEFAEFSDVLLHRKQGRESERERILSYNIGIALHDIFFASKIYDLISTRNEEKDLNLSLIAQKYWV